jgi:threonine/homoserine/homoserine lactone efflux protein
MSPESWLAFTLASAALLALPGPTVLLVVSYALGQGRRAALPVVAGVALGDLVSMTASLLGLGVLLAAPALRPRRMLAHAFAVTALNPKSLIFFVAFLPQFLDAHRPLAPQLVLCEATFVVLATLNALAYALAASAARRAIRRPRVQRAVNRTGGGLLVGAGVLAATWHRA